MVINAADARDARLGRITATADAHEAVHAWFMLVDFQGSQCQATQSTKAHNVRKPQVNPNPKSSSF